MTRIDSTKVKWRVQVRTSRAHKWVSRGLFETRKAAREEASDLRIYICQNRSGFVVGPYGAGNTRVIRHISGKGRASKEGAC